MTVQQIIPADGVVALYEGGKRFPVVCWALIAEDTGDPEFGTLTHVVGMILINESHALDFCGRFSEQCGAEKFKSYEYSRD
jgi:hypothetical protein